MVKIAIEKLEKAEWNYKKNDQALMEKLVANIKRNGQIENLIVRELPKGKYEIVNGNHRYDALVELKTKKAWCYNLGKIKLAMAKRIAIETNETRFDSDMGKLDDLMKELEKSFNLGDLKMTMPFNEKEFGKMFENDDINFDDNENIKTQMNICPKCGFKYEK